MWLMNNELWYPVVVETLSDITSGYGNADSSPSNKLEIRQRDVD